MLDKHGGEEDVDSSLTSFHEPKRGRRCFRMSTNGSQCCK